MSILYSSSDDLGWKKISSERASDGKSLKIIFHALPHKDSFICMSYVSLKVYSYKIITLLIFMESNKSVSIYTQGALEHEKLRK